MKTKKKCLESLENKALDKSKKLHQIKGGLDPLVIDLVQH